MKIIGICGSLRAVSKNLALLNVAGKLAPSRADFVAGNWIGSLPLFNPDLDDLDHGRAPEAALTFRRELQASDGVMICSPEYAHGVSGVMKNALDWLVGTGEFVDKPTVVLNGSPASVHAHAALVETLKTMRAIVIEATLPVAMGGSSVTEEELLASKEVKKTLESGWNLLVSFIDKKG